MRVTVQAHTLYLSYSSSVSTVTMLLRVILLDAKKKTDPFEYTARDSRRRFL